MTGTVPEHVEREREAERQRRLYRPDGSPNHAEHADHALTRMHEARDWPAARKWGITAQVHAQLEVAESQRAMADELKARRS